MKKIFDLMKVDLINMNGGKNNIKTIFVLMFLMFGVFGFLFSPMISTFCPMLMGYFFVPMLFQNELKYHSDKLHSLLPIARRDLVNARFLLTLGIYTVSSLLFYLLMLISLQIKPYYLVFGAYAEHIDIIALLAERSGGAMTELGVFNLIYALEFSFGIIGAAGGLRNYFNDPEKSGMTLSFGKAHKAREKDKNTALTVLSVILLLWVLIVSGNLPVGPAAAVIIQLFVQLAGAANGFLLGAVSVTIAVFSAVYKYVCTVLEYDEKEL